MISKPCVIVTCDDDRGCVNQTEIELERDANFDEDAIDVDLQLANAVDRKLAAEGWTRSEGKDRCEECSRLKANYDALTEKMIVDGRSDDFGASGE